MKRSLRFIALMLATLLLLLPSASCSGNKDKSVATLDGHSITLYEFEYFLATYKGALASSGYPVSSSAFWDQALSLEGDSYKTANEYYTDLIIDNVKTYVSAMYLFDDMGLSLSAHTVEEIDEYMERLVNDYGDGSMTKLNSTLSQYGVNYDMLREIYLKQEKLVVLKNALYGSDGSKISNEIKTQYYEENYVRFKHIFFYTYDMIYETDENGDEIYYTNTGKIAYDKDNGILKYDENGVSIKDKKGDAIYYTEDGKIAYDTKNGSKAVKRDKDGNALTEEYTKEELEQVQKNISDVMEAYESEKYSFDELVDLFSEDEGKGLYPNGYYLTKDSPYNIDAVMDTLFNSKTGEAAMKIGEVKIVKSDLGYHIIKRYELDESGYSNKENEDFFTTMIPSLAEKLFLMKLDEYKDRVIINDELIGSIDIKSVGINKTF